MDATIIGLPLMYTSRALIDINIKRKQKSDANSLLDSYCLNASSAGMLSLPNPHTHACSVRLSVHVFSKGRREYCTARHLCFLQTSLGVAYLSRKFNMSSPSFPIICHRRTVWWAPYTLDSQPILMKLAGSAISQKCNLRILGISSINAHFLYSCLLSGRALHGF